MCDQAAWNRSTRRAGDLGGARAGRCRWVRIWVITTGSTIAAMIFRRPPQFAQCSTSISNTRLSRQAKPHARRRGGWALGVVIASVMGVERRARNDLGPQFGVGREHTMEANQMQPGPRHQCGQALHELQRRHHDMRGAVAPGALELQHDLAGWIAFEPFVGNGRAGDIAAQSSSLR